MINTYVPCKEGQGNACLLYRGSVQVTEKNISMMMV